MVRGFLTRVCFQCPLLLWPSWKHGLRRQEIQSLSQARDCKVSRALVTLVVVIALLR